MGRCYLHKAATVLWTAFLICNFTCAARAFPSVISPTPLSAQADDKADSLQTITVEEAASLLDVLPVTKELRAKGIVVKWESQSVATMNNREYYFFWGCSCTDQKPGDIGSNSVGNYAVHKHTGDVRAWQVSHDVLYGDDGTLVAAKELEQLQDELRNKHGIDSMSVQKYRFVHLANKVIPREEAQSAIHLPIAERSADTAELSCWKRGSQPRSTFGRSPILSSSAGYRAYAEATAIALSPIHEETYEGSLCENYVKVYLANEGAASAPIIFDSSVPKDDCFQVEGRDSCDVKGVQLVDWSNDGRFLLADLVWWVYESDAFSLRAPVVYDVTKHEFVRPDVYHFFDDYFKTDAFKDKSDASGTHCEFELSAKGFSPDGKVVLSASRTPDDPSYGQVFCVTKKQTFLFDSETHKINRLPATYEVQHYGTWSYDIPGKQ
ncbi:MAG TPA: hypothetical protein VIH76_03570 [Candidatus Acidoferrales bacterium]